MKPGVAIRVQYIKCVDGDTYDFEIKKSFRVRLKDIDVAELRAKGGIEAKIFAEEILSKAKDIIVFIPSEDSRGWMVINSFNRIVGEVYVDGESMENVLREKGYEKQK